MKNYVIGIFLAQLGIPAGLLVLSVFSGLPLKGVVILSLGGFTVSLVASLLIGIPASYALAKYNILTFWPILGVSLLVPLSVTMCSGGTGLGFLFFVTPFCIIGACIYWYYLKSKKALTSKASRRINALLL